MPPAPADSSGAKQQRFLPVHIDSLDPQLLEMDLWIKHPGQSHPALYRARGLEIQISDFRRLREQRIHFVYITAADYAIYRKQLVRKLDSIFHDKQKADAERVRIVRANCLQMIEDVLILPGQAEPIEAVADVARTFSSWVAADENAFSYLFDMSEHDFQTSVHMMNVGVGSGLLVRHLRPDDSQLFSLVVQGGLLHDIGKRGIPHDILNKGGRLEPEEWDLIKRHPQIGFEELSRHPAVPSTVLEMTRDHHERLDGRGYPHGLVGSDITFAARVCSVVDVFDALSATRPYKGPTHPRDVLRLMAETVGSQFDPEIFEGWRTLVEKLLDKDPQRTADVKEGENVFPVKKILQGEVPKLSPALLRICDLVASGNSAGVAGTQRRRHKRFNCKTLVKVKFLRQIKPYPIEIGETFEVALADVSRSGVGFYTQVPMARGDLLHVTLPSKDGKTIECIAQVVRVRYRDEGRWLNGLCFLDADAKAA